MNPAIARETAHRVPLTRILGGFCGTWANSEYKPRAATPAVGAVVVFRVGGRLSGA